MMRIFFLFILFFSSFILHGQEYYRVFLKDKQGVAFSPNDYFSDKAIKRRIKNNLPVCDSSDFPIKKEYIDILTKKGCEIFGQSRWFNMLYVKTNETLIRQIKELNFILKTERIDTPHKSELCVHEKHMFFSQNKDKVLTKQIEHLNGQLFHAKGFKGKGVRIAIFDGGFPNIDFLPCFNHIFANKQIIATYDFVRQKDFVYGYDIHGTYVLACIAGMYKGQPTGLATEAEFLLARTEVKSEPFSEEKNWLEAAEWADKHGADIINSSLGYTYHRYFPQNMDGTHSYVAKAAQKASDKGMLVVNSMGNDGQNDWKVICTPADVDDVLSVGAIQPYTGFHANFSSFGPTADMRMKPNISAFGIVSVPMGNGLSKVNGTSFSAPLISGFAACALQTDSTLTNKKLKAEIEKSASLYPYYDYAHGFGVPNAAYFTNKNHIKKSTPAFSLKKGKNKLIVEVDSTAITKKFRDNNYLYYHIENKEKYLDKFAVIEVSEQKVLEIEIKELEGKILRCHFKGQTLEFKAKEN